VRQTRTFGRFTTTFSMSADEPSSVVLLSLPFENPTPLATNAPLVLDDPGSLMIVVSGELDLFYVRVGEDGLHGARRYVGTLRPGDVVSCARPGSGASGVLVAVGYGDATVQMMSSEALEDESQDGARIARALGTGLAESIGRAMYRASRAPARTVEVALQPVRLKQGAAITAGAEVVWLWADDGELALGGTASLDKQPLYTPLVRGMWVSVASPTASVTVVDTYTAFASGTTRLSLMRAWNAFMTWVELWFDAEDAQERERLARKLEGEHERHGRALASLAGLLRPEEVAQDRNVHGDPLLDACAAVCTAAGITMRVPPAWSTVQGSTADDRQRDRVGAIATASFIRHRRVALQGDWWRSDSGPLLGFAGKEQRPVALISSARGGYTVHDPVTTETIPVTAAFAATIATFAYTFYRPLPAGPLPLRALGRLVLTDIWPDLKRVIVLVFAGAVLGLALPVVTGKMFNDVIPSADMGNAYTLFASLVAIALGAAAFDVSRAFALVRAEGRSNAMLQAAIVDRLLSLPAQFFRKFSVGDLADRSDAINAARQMLTGVAITSLLGGALTLTSLALMWFISSKLALVAIGALAVGAVVTAAVGVYTLPYERRRQGLHGAISALVFELLGGIAKLHVAAAEPRMFALWGAKFRELKVVSYRAGLGAAVLTVFNDALPLLASGALFMVGIKLFALPTGGITTGNFIAFNTAFGMALAAGTGVSNTLVSVLNIVPLLERAEPILTATPEVDDARPDAGPISGRIEVAHVSFGYIADAAPILNDVSFEIRPGEFVAFVGPSGAGKSTILRLLLGFEKPDRGAIYYDGKDLASIDVAAIRRQAAVVLQQSRLLAGDIFTNIVGASPLTIEDAWHAAELAGLADDIKAMPMGMHTVISEGASTLSGGQRQRVLIARALVRNPRVVFFDEATSALDNRSQEVVTRSLEKMQASRIVIAHRLTTVQRADRIFVLSGGHIVQQGRYEDLVVQEGMFQQLAARQLV
jgi:ATP-binding cassette subfamily C protein